MTYSEYLELERQEMLRHKWIESEKAGHDLGQEALIDWAIRYCTGFRKHVVRVYGSISSDMRQAS